MRMNIIIAVLIIATMTYSAARVKRRILFRKNTKFFLRLNGKEPVLNFTTIVQHGWGFRLNWELPDTIPKLHKLYRRDISIELQEYFQRPELQSFFCILKYFVNKLKIVEFGDYCGVLCEITEIIKWHEGDDSNLFKKMLETIRNFDVVCPDFGYESAIYTDV